MGALYNILIYSVLGIVQGFSEPIPISSSGHLVIVKALMENHLGMAFPETAANDMAFDVLLHLASLIAIMFYYRKDIIKLITDFFKFIFKKESRGKTQYNFKYCWYIVIATIPAALGGYFLEDRVDAAFNNVKMVGCSLIVTAVLLMMVHCLANKGRRTKKAMGIGDAIVMGIFQFVALLPGISRSGSTLTGGVFMGLTKKTARDFSFFMFMPVALGSVVLKIKYLFNGAFATLWLPYLVAFIMAMITTFLALKLLFAVLNKNKMNLFSIYCLLMGLCALFLI